jgi:hypothetical protein
MRNDTMKDFLRQSTRVRTVNHEDYNGPDMWLGWRRQLKNINCLWRSLLENIHLEETEDRNYNIIMDKMNLREMYYRWVVNGNGSGPSLMAGFGISSMEPWIMLAHWKCLVNEEPDQTVAGLPESALLPQISFLSGKKYYSKHSSKLFLILVFIVPVGSIRMQKHKNRQIANTIYLFTLKWSD